MNTMKRLLMLRFRSDIILTELFKETIPSDRPVAPISTTSNCTDEDVSVEMLNNYWKIFAAEESDISCHNSALRLLEWKCMRVVQVAALAYLFKSKYQQLQFVKFTSYFLHDSQNKHILTDSIPI